MRPALPLVSPMGVHAMALRALALLALVPAGGCQTYEPPPTAKLVGLKSGVLGNSLDPLVLRFDAPVDPATASIEVAPFDIDAYGNLPDERPGGGMLDVLLRYGAGGDLHATGSFDDSHTQLTLDPMPAQWLPVGPSLVLLVDPGLTAAGTGTVLHYRERIPFSYAVACGGGHTTLLTSGDYFFLMQVNKPLGVELKAFAALDVDRERGTFVGQFTAAIRNADPDRCHPPCTGGLVCQLLPAEACVEMSAPPNSVDEWPDYVAKSTAPDGYTFSMHGCAVDAANGAVNILTAPGVLKVVSPAVTIEGLTFTAQFVPASGGLVRGSGSLTATKTLLGTFDLGAGAGTLDAVSIPKGAVKGLPEPTPDAGAGDAGGPP